MAVVDFIYHLPPVGYFMNHLDPSTWFDYSQQTLDICAQSQMLEKGFVGAMSSMKSIFDLIISGSSWIVHDISDKLLTRCLLSDRGICVPDFIALKSHDTVNTVRKDVFQRYNANIRIHDGNQSLDNYFSEALDIFYTRYSSQYKEIVVKPSGVKYSSGFGVRIYNLTNPTSNIEEHSKCRAVIIAHMKSLWKDLAYDDSILIDGRVSPPPILLTEKFKGPNRFVEGSKRWDYVIRWVCVRSGETGVTCGGMARVGKWGGPVNGSNLGIITCSYVF